MRFGLPQSLIQKQLQTDFPDQAADLQALQDVSSSVSTNSGLLRQGARTAPPVMSSKPRSLDIELPEWMQIGKAMLPVLEKLMFGNWERINESHKLGDGRKVTIAGYGHENKASHTITIEDINGQTMVLTGEQILDSDDGTQTPLLALTGGSVNGRKLSESELRSFSEALTFAGVRTVLNNDVNEDGEEGERPPPGIGDNSIPSGIEPIDEEVDRETGEYKDEPPHFGSSENNEVPHNPDKEWDGRGKGHNALPSGVEVVPDEFPGSTIVEEEAKDNSKQDTNQKRSNKKNRRRKAQQYAQKREYQAGQNKENKVRTGASKAEPHGDGGRDLLKNKGTIESIDKELETATGVHKKKLKVKRKRIIKSGQKKKKGETHWN